ncbi:hypothetical protein [Jiella pacifica]|uniref:Uncharacterized protein n=1 Tax=Jiella pacifica TaxID=2696469 RepID=A0A6N9TD45_9HYPH|nr:hypothetical protein [Jiella pacifica]NDW07589.1 hypothetical protein [Jiella pacifica]
MNLTLLPAKTAPANKHDDLSHVSVAPSAAEFRWAGMMGKVAVDERRIETEKAAGSPASREKKRSDADARIAASPCGITMQPRRLGSSRGATPVCR